MKTVMIIGCLLLLTFLGQAQNQTIKLYIQQIAANAVYIEYLQKGYRIAKNGLTTISNIKNGHWTLDKDFFAGLHNINPKVSNYAKVADIMALNIKIARQCKAIMKQARAADLFNSGEVGYFDQVFAMLLDACASLTEELTVTITPNKLTMSDDERIKRIDLLYADMQDKYVFVNSFSNEITKMTLQRSKESNESASIRNLYGQ
ncbi:MAG: hypothetical protein QM768_12535 [Agriterribacter sp.]